MRILFSVRNPSYVRHYEPVLRALAARGHRIMLASEHTSKRPWPPSVLELAATCPGIELSRTPIPATDPWLELVTWVRQARFYLRFLDRRYRDMPALLARARERTPDLAIRLGRLLGATGATRALLVRTLNLVEAAARTPERFHKYVREARADLVFLTPLVVLKTFQPDLARAAQELGVRTLFGAASWDHLSSKGELTFQPQRALVWNDIQKRELVDLHGVDAARVEVTGSQVFDEWFVKQPATTRDAFCARVGLRSDRPLLLYVCSSLLEGSDPEPAFVLRWLHELRRSGHPVLRDCGVLIRPHFKRVAEWRDVTFDGLTQVVCWPRQGAVPDSAAAKADYFDSLYHADAVTGVNTSAMIEAGILGRPVHTVLLPELRENQEGTMHFHYLLDGPDALLHAERSLDAHFAGLAASLERGEHRSERSARFVRTFVRPGPIDRPATDRIVDIIEAMAAAPAPRRAARPLARWLKPLLRPLARAAAERSRRLDEERRRQKEAMLEEHRRRKRALEESGA